MKIDLTEKLEKELTELIRKYRTSLKAGEIADAVIGKMTLLVCAKAISTNELEFVEQDLIEIIINNVARAKRFAERENENRPD